jgi:thiamine pyrophosphate-dependent acetolactate synthase large subunit-like protein
MSGPDKVEEPAGIEHPQPGWVSDVAAEMMRRMGLRYLAMNPGASYRGLHDSLVNYLGNRAPQILLCLHEDHAVSIAQGYARATGEPMGCILHSNVGLMHGLMGIFNAWCNRLPMLVIGATGPVDAPARRPWIDWIHTSKDQGALLRNFTKWDDEPRSVDAMVESFCRGMMLTRTAPTAPVYICLDAALQERSLDRKVPLPDLSLFATPAAPAAADHVVAQAAAMLAAARRPLILPGRLSRREHDWQNRIRLAEAADATVVTDAKTWAVFATDHPRHLNVPGLRLSQAAKDAIKEADLILALDWVDLGGSLQTVFGTAQGAMPKIINCTLDSYLHNGWSMDHFALPAVDLSVLADPDTFVAQLLAAVPRKQAAVPQQRRETARAKPRDPAASIDAGDIEHALASVRGKHPFTLSNIAREFDTDICPFQHPLDYLGHDGGGGLGSATGASIGAALGLEGSGRKVICIIGDGDFLQGATAIWTAAHYRIPVLWIVWNNRSNFNDEGHQQTVARARGRPPENKWIGQRIDDPAINLAGVARDLGVASEGPVKTVGEFGLALARALAVLDSGAPYLIDVFVVPKERGGPSEASQRGPALG